MRSSAIATSAMATLIALMGGLFANAAMSQDVPSEVAAAINPAVLKELREGPLKAAKPALIKYRETGTMSGQRNISFDANCEPDIGAWFKCKTVVTIGGKVSIETVYSLGGVTIFLEAVDSVANPTMTTVTTAFNSNVVPADVPVGSSYSYSISRALTPRPAMSLDLRYQCHVAAVAESTPPRLKEFGPLRLHTCEVFNEKVPDKKPNKPVHFCLLVGAQVMLPPGICDPALDTFPTGSKDAPPVLDITWVMPPSKK